MHKNSLPKLSIHISIFKFDNLKDDNENIIIVSVTTEIGPEGLTEFNI